MSPLFRAAALALLLSAAGCATHRAPAANSEEEGLAGYYGPGFEGRRTASGAVFHAEGLTCAHRTLPFGTELEVQRTDADRRVRVVVTDRGPYVSGRIIDLSLGAARKLGLVQRGVAPVRLRVLRLPPPKR